MLNGGANTDILWNVPGGAGAVATVKVTVWKCGVEHTELYPVFVKGTPQITAVTLVNDTVCSGTPVLVNVTTDYPVSSATYLADWGNPPGVTTTETVTAVGTNTYQYSHAYNTDGMNSAVSFTPSITIKDANGCTGAVTANAPTVTVMPRPVAWISLPGTIAHCGTGWTETLTATETTGIGGSNTFTWTKDGLPLATTSSVIVNDYGNYTVTVTNDMFGCASSKTTKIIELCPDGGSGCGAPPAVMLSPDPNIGNCGTILVHATTTATSVEWLLPPGVTMGTGTTDADLEATATVAGEYPIVYRVHYGSGCSFDYLIIVKVPYIPDLRHAVNCNMPGSNYAITLYDHSTVYPPGTGTGITRSYYAGSTLLASGAGLLSTVAYQAPGTTATYTQVIQSGSYAACSSSFTYTTPSFPVASIGLVSVPNPGCVDDVVFMFSNAGSSAGSYWWNFDDGTYNTNSGPTIGKVYSSPFTYYPSIKVTDEFGCYATATISTPVDVKSNPYLGSLTATGSPACQGDLVTLKYGLVAPSIDYPISFIWYEQATPIATTTGAPYEIVTGTPGGYWVEATGNYGCKVKTNMVDVIINQVPPVAIAGNTRQCVDQSFVLTTQNYGPSYTYTWSGPGATGTGPSITLTHTSPVPTPTPLPLPMQLPAASAQALLSP